MPHCGTSSRVKINVGIPRAKKYFSDGFNCEMLLFVAIKYHESLEKLSWFTGAAEGTWTPTGVAPIRTWILRVCQFRHCRVCLFETRAVHCAKTILAHYTPVVNISNLRINIQIITAIPLKMPPPISIRKINTKAAFLKLVSHTCYAYLLCGVVDPGYGSGRTCSEASSATVAIV